MSAMDAPPLRARTALLEELRDMQKQQQQQQRKTEITHTRKSDDSVNDRDNNDNDGELGSSVPMAVRFVRGCPPLGDPSWAMEELLRINQNVAVWTGESGGTKELVIHNPKATLSNLRAAIAINFRLPVHSFRMIHSSVDFSSEQILLRDSGIQDGDLITVAAKRDREEEESEGQQQQQQEGEKGEASGKHTAVEITKTSTTNDSSLSVVPASSGEVVREAEGSGVGQMMINNNDSDEEMEEEDEEDMMEDGAREMLSHLLATVPNLLEMRQQFLANPAEIMQQIREQDPRLFELITANHQEFLDLVNNEALVETLQREQEEEQNGLLDEEEGDFEYEDEAEDLINSLMAEYMGSVAAAALADGDDENEPNEATDVAITETQRYLDRIPTEEEEAKIEQLMQLGFTKDQCKVAFFKAKRSLERAANLLFEDPPQL